jgi:hypothetical protein
VRASPVFPRRRSPCSRGSLARVDVWTRSAQRNVRPRRHRRHRRRSEQVMHAQRAASAKPEHATASGAPSRASQTSIAASTPRATSCGASRTAPERARASRAAHRILIAPRSPEQPARPLRPRTEPQRACARSKRIDGRKKVHLPHGRLHACLPLCEVH